MWIRTLIVAFGLALGIGLCAYVARQFTKIGGKGAVGTAFRWGLFPLAVFLLTFPLLAMHGLLRAIEGMTILILDLSTLLFFIGLVIGLWKESLRYKGPFVMDRTIALNRPVKKVFSVLLVIGLLALAPFLISYAATLILEDLTDLSISSPALEPAVRSFFDFYFPVGIGAAILSAVSATFSLAWDWTLGGVIESILTRITRARFGG